MTKRWKVKSGVFVFYFKIWSNLFCSFHLFFVFQSCHFYFSPHVCIFRKCKKAPIEIEIDACFLSVKRSRSRTCPLISRFVRKRVFFSSNTIFISKQKYLRYKNDADFSLSPFPFPPTQKRQRSLLFCLFFAFAFVSLSESSRPLQILFPSSVFVFVFAFVLLSLCLSLH
jgi:hypothetical protein